MRTINKTISVMLLAVTGVINGQAVQADTFTITYTDNHYGDPAYHVHYRDGHGYHAPRYWSRHHGHYHGKKHKHYRKNKHRRQHGHHGYHNYRDYDYGHGKRHSHHADHGKRDRRSRHDHTGRNHSKREHTANASRRVF